MGCSGMTRVVSLMIKITKIYLIFMWTALVFQNQLFGRNMFVESVSDFMTEKKIW